MTWGEYNTVPLQRIRVANRNAAIKVLPFHAEAVLVLRRISLLLVALCTIATAHRVYAAQAYIIADSKTGFILQQLEPKQKRQVGSLTKIATAAVVLDWAEHKSGNLAEVATIPPEAFVGVTENHIGFQPGDRIELRDLLYAALVQSDNIAAYALAAHVGGQLQSIVLAGGKKMSAADVFVSQMNALAKQLKMERTRFVNPHGIDEKVHPTPFSTAEDMARLARYAMNKAGFRFYVSQKERQISFEHLGHKQNYLLRNTNELLGRDGIDGVKTGQTARAGECLVLSANREAEIVKEGQMTTVFPRHLIIVLLGSTNRFAEGDQLVRTGWKLYDQWVASGRIIDPEKVL
jgi:serine-type D-Ala-D-Ala carboxypeptidase (penicillin-binding protein 5/6)